MSLSLHVSNSCNLRCVYCYADGGSYGRPPRTKMEKTLAIRALDTMYRTFSHIESILFFGGEPTLAMDVIEAVCSHVEDLKVRGVTRTIPEYGVVTNGTLISGEAVRIIKRYNIQVTMSVDGPPAIHDKLRPRKDGTGTYKQVKAGFDRIVSALGQTPHIEATYTRLHLNSGMRMQDLAGFLRKEFLFRVGAIIPVHVPQEHPLALTDEETRTDMAATTEMLLHDFIEGHSPTLERTLLAPFLLFLRKRATRFLCSVGHTRLTVTTDGEIYPCHRLMRPSFLMGTVDDFDIARPTQQLKDALRNLSYCDKYTNPLCRACWASPLCLGCPGAHIFESNNYHIPDRFCREMRTFIENNIGALYDLKRDPALWSQFLAGLKKLSAELQKDATPHGEAC